MNQISKWTGWSDGSTNAIRSIMIGSSNLYSIGTGEPLLITRSGLQTDGSLVFIFASVRNQSYWIQYSDDLMTWQPGPVG